MKFEAWVSLSKLSDYELARLTGFDHSTMSRTRRGITKPSWGLIAKIHEVSQGAVTANDFFNDFGAGREK